MHSSELKLLADEYKLKLDVLTGERQEAERKLIILEEQHKQYKEKIEQAFNTTDVDKLRNIAEEYLQNIQKLEKDMV